MLNKSYRFSKDLGKRIQKARKTIGYSQEDLAHTLRISRTHMGHIEQGRRTPSVGVLEKVARALKRPIKDLL